MRILEYNAKPLISHSKVDICGVCQEYLGEISHNSDNFTVEVGGGGLCCRDYSAGFSLQPVAPFTNMVQL